MLDFFIKLPYMSIQTPFKIFLVFNKRKQSIKIKKNIDLHFDAGQTRENKSNFQEHKVK